MKFNKGDIICRKGQLYPAGALTVVGKNKKGELVTHSKGGGFEIIIPEPALDNFRLVSKEEIQATLYETGKFQICDCEETFDGWSKGELWNGWDKPYFEFEACIKIQNWLGKDRIIYDVERDAFIVKNEDTEDEVWEAETIGISDGTCITAYGLGAGSWMWETLQPANMPQGKNTKGSL